MSSDDATGTGLRSEDCPRWCAGYHDEDALPEDRHHDSTEVYLPIIIKPRREAAADAEPPPESTEILVVTSRRFGQKEDWTFIGEPDRPRQHLQLSRESARRLATALTAHLDSLD